MRKQRIRVLNIRKFKIYRLSKDMNLGCLTSQPDLRAPSKREYSTKDFRKRFNKQKTKEYQQPADLHWVLGNAAHSAP